MGKQKIGAKTYLYPMPTVLVGALVNAKPNFMTIAYCGIVGHEPPFIEITADKEHYTSAGIKENQTFSVNLPSARSVEITDFVGLNSGNDVDKSDLFTVFFGELETAPMIQEVPLNLECKLEKTIELDEGTDYIFIGRIVQTYIDEECLTNKKPDIKKINPIIFSMHENNYWKIGECIGKAFKIGEKYKKANDVD